MEKNRKERKNLFSQTLPIYFSTRLFYIHRRLLLVLSSRRYSEVKRSALKIRWVAPPLPALLVLYEPVKKMGRKRGRENTERISFPLSWILHREGLVMILSRERKVGNFILVPRLV